MSGLFVSPWLTVKGGSLRTISRIAELEAARVERRKRGRTAKALQSHRALVETVVANLAYRVVEGRPFTPLVQLLDKYAKRTRYDREGLRLIGDLLRRLHEARLIRLRVSKTRGKGSTITATRRFVEMVQAAGVTFADFGRAEGEEVIVLKTSEAGFIPNQYGGGSFRRTQEWVDYADTRDTKRFREEMKRINTALALADIEYVGRQNVDVEKRHLKRHFTLPSGGSPETATFDRNGRLFGGWWDNLDKAERAHIRIDGEKIADLDFVSMFARLAYARLELEPPAGDLYEIEGLDRDVVKVLLSALLFAERPRTRVPKGFKEALPGGWTIHTVRDAVLRRHPGLESVLETGVGMSLMFAESQILIAVMMELIIRGVSVLPMHDGIMVAASKAGEATAVMEAEALRIAGVELPVARKE